MIIFLLDLSTERNILKHVGACNTQGLLNSCFLRVQHTCIILLVLNFAENIYYTQKRKKKEITLT